MRSVLNVTHFCPTPSQKKEKHYNQNLPQDNHVYEPPYKLYNIGISSLKPFDKITRYWISFRDPVNLGMVTELLRKRFPVELCGYAGLFQTEVVHTCWVELAEPMNWVTVETLTKMALKEIA